MSYPCCYHYDDGIYDYWRCSQVIGPRDCEAYGNITETHLGMEGRECVEEGGCWDCKYDLDISGDCCITDTDGQVQHFPDVTSATCRNCGGFPPIGGRCVSEPQQPDCRAAAADRKAPDGLRWTYDLEAPIAYCLDPETGLAGRTGLTSATPVRTKAPAPGETQPCQPAGGRLVMLDDGYLYVETVSQPKSDTASLVVTYAALDVPEVVREEHDDETEYVKPGYTYWVGCYRPPAWGEAVYRSTKQLCEGPER